jgi:hypothetical protein
MIKILEAFALFILSRSNKAKPGDHGLNPAHIASEFLASKGRLIILSLVAAITLAILTAGGVLLMLVGGAEWLAGDSIPAAHWFVYFGSGLTLSCGILTSIGFSKKRFELEPVAKVEKKEMIPIQSKKWGLEEVILAVIKALLPGKKHIESETPSTPTAASSTPTSVQTA